MRAELERDPIGGGELKIGQDFALSVTASVRAYRVR